MSAKYSENDIRLIVLEYLMKEYEGVDHVLAVEARYAEKKRRADLLALTMETHAFEIKSDFDTTKRLRAQLDDYRKTFDYVSVVTTDRHMRSVKEQLGKNVGLINVSDGNVQVLRTANLNKKLAKQNLLAMCSKPSLAQLLGRSVSSASLEEFKKAAERNVRVDELRRLAISELHRRFKHRYRDFRSEVSFPLRESDLKSLQHQSRLSLSDL